METGKREGARRSPADEELRRQKERLGPILDISPSAIVIRLVMDRNSNSPGRLALPRSPLRADSGVTRLSRLLFRGCP